MNRAEKQIFIRELCDNVRDGLLDRVGDMPEEWDGHELRALLAMRFERANFGALQDSKARRRAFRIAVVERNL